MKTARVDQNRLVDHGDPVQLCRSFAVASSIGKKHSMRSSCNVTSCGAPRVAIVVNKRKLGTHFVKYTLTPGPGSALFKPSLSAFRTPWEPRTRSSRAIV